MYKIDSSKWLFPLRDDRLLFSSQCKPEIETDEARLEHCQGNGFWLVECLPLDRFGEQGREMCLWSTLESGVSSPGLRQM
jgi:hypothetical protein